MSYAIEINNLTFSYKQQEIFNDFNLSLKKGKFTAILGHNGSGKSTLAKLIIGLLEPISGEIKVNGIALSSETVREIRANTALVFQNPDNQFVGVTVREDIAFGLENHQVEREKMIELIDEFSNKVGMSEFLDKNPHELSGGQKQRVAIAGVLCLNPSILILDESTSMLDPKGRSEVMEMIEIIKEFNEDVTIISITHDIEEALHADEVVVLNKGELVFQGSPEKAVMNEEILNNSRIELPQYITLSKKLKENKIIDKIYSTTDELINYISNRVAINEKNRNVFKRLNTNQLKEIKSVESSFKISFDEVSFNYRQYDKNSKDALKSVTTKIENDDIVAIVGHTGSGKSTFIQHLNALITPTEGTVNIGDKVVYSNKKNKKLKSLRQKVGLVFQFPEYQLFEETVLKDIMYGPLNFGVAKEDAERKALEMADLVGISEEILERIPFKLSGGQMRKVAIAGVLAMEPAVLVLDEPTVGLDPETRRTLLETLLDIRKKTNKKIILVTHDMNVVSEYTDYCIVFNEGKIAFEGKTNALFNEKEIINECALDYPDLMKISIGIANHLEIKEDINIKSLDITFDLITELLS